MPEITAPDQAQESTKPIYTLPKVARPDWLAGTLPQLERQLKVMQLPHFPSVLKGHFALTMAMRLLRCVYGSDAQGAAALSEELSRKLEIERYLATLSPAQMERFFQDEELKIERKQAGK
jgi:hypothetical protein